MSVSLGQECAKGAIDGVRAHFQLERATAPGTEIGVGTTEDAGAYLHQIGTHARLHLTTVGWIERFQDGAPYLNFTINGHRRCDAHRCVNKTIEARHADEACRVAFGRAWARHQGASFGKPATGEGICPAGVGGRAAGSPAFLIANEAYEDQEIFDVLGEPVSGWQVGSVHGLASGDKIGL